ncbi:MAG: NAD(P)-binding domain-containing protein [Gemmatimonadota bacterium]|jgi:hypothetical protein
MDRTERHIRFVVLGAGPAGLQMAYFLQKAGADYVVLERAEAPGLFFRRFPRSRSLISFNKTSSVFDDPEIQLRWDWNTLLTHDHSFPFREYSRRLYPLADELVRYLAGFREAYDLDVRFGTEVVSVSPARDGDGASDASAAGRTEPGDAAWSLRTADGDTWTCEALVVATGFGRPYVPAIPGIEHAIGYEEAPFDPGPYEGRRVLVVGKGNSALEVADVALESAAVVHVASPTPLTMAHRTHHPGHVRANHARILDGYHLKTLNSVLNCQIQSIVPVDGDASPGDAPHDGGMGDGAGSGGEGQQDGPFVVTVAYTRADGEVDELVYDVVVRCTGFAFDGGVFETHPRTVLDGRLPDITPYWESTSHPGVFFAGSLMQARDFKVAASAFIDGFRYNVRTLYRHLMERYEDRPYPRRTLRLDAELLASTVAERACHTSGLWNQFRYLCDLFVVGDEGIDWYEEVPFQAVEEGLMAEEPWYYTLTFEWGRWEGNPMDIQRHPEASQAHRSVFLHPVVRRWRHGEVLDQHHLLEDLFGVYAAHREARAILSHSGLDIEEYHRQHHEAPLVEYFRSHTGSADRGDPSVAPQTAHP